MRIAVVGSGITGLSAAWLLGTEPEAAHDVILFEAAPRIGGHSNTVDVAAPEGVIPIDTGFIVYNAATYPNLIALFEHLGVATAASTMSFAVSLDGGDYEYCGTGARGLFAQASNIVSPAHWRMTADILRFHREAAALTTAANDPTLSLGAWLTRQRYSQPFIERHILPMAAAIWSAPADAMLAFPAASFARFFANHGLLTAYNQPTWRTVVGGSRSYVTAMLGAMPGPVRRGEPVVRVASGPRGVTVTTQAGRVEVFDRVALCCHADEALAVLDAPSHAERAVLGAFQYSTNEAVLHTDASVMPRRRAVWSSWNYQGSRSDPAGSDCAVGGARPRPVTVTYWMNSLQPLATKTNYFVTLNPARSIDPGKIIQTFSYTHPLYDRAALQAQAAIWDLQGQRQVWFGGAYCGYGFHEDGVQAGLAVAEHMTADASPVRRPWTVADQSGRLALPASWTERVACGVPVRPRVRDGADA